MSNGILNTKIRKARILCTLTLSWFLFSFTSKVAYAENTNCTDIHNATCINRGTINYYILNGSENIITNEGSLKPTSNDVVIGNLKFKFLKCHASEDTVRCDIQVYNPTSIDRTLFVASQQNGGIRSTALGSLGITTMIDANGASYPANTVVFANHSGGETGQSYFTVYSHTPTKLSVIFTGVENPATISRLDLLVGENKSSGLLYDRIKYPVKPE